jgi:hydroxymethylbilane synthase
VAANQKIATLLIGTRGSDLAVVQAELVAEALRDGLGVETELRVIRTAGDRITDRPFREIEGVGVFTREIEDALLAGSIHLAVHSQKDMPLTSLPGLSVAAVSRREDPGDMLIIRRGAYSESIGTPINIPLRPGATVGTSSARRESQLLAIRPDLKILELRGNVPTRLEKLGEGKYDAILLAVAGIKRLGLELNEFWSQALEPTQFVPAPGQGALAIQLRSDSPLKEPVRQMLHDINTDRAVTWERGVLRQFGGGCGLPLGVYARWTTERWELFGFWGGDPEHPVWTTVKGGYHYEEEEK